MEKITNTIKLIAGQYLWIALSLTILQVIAVFAPISFIYATVLLFVNLLLFLLLKELVEEKTRKRGFLLFKLSLPLFIMGIISLLGRTLAEATGKTGVNPVMILLYVATAISVVVFALDEDKKKAFDNIYEAKTLGKLGKKKEERKEGDIQLCLSSETKEPVIIPFKDRFLHMLILGATGTGKTSQVLLPLIEQDMQNSEYGVTIIEPKGDLAEKVAAMGRYHGKEVVYFNPIHQNCPYFNPLYGIEDDVIENMATTFKMLNPDSPQFFQDMNETLIRNSLKVLKRLKGNNATLLDLSTLVYNTDGQGRTMINALAQLGRSGLTAEKAKENMEITSWFIGEYYNAKSKVYEHCGGLRSQIGKIISNSHLRRVLNPPNGENDVNFGKIIEEGKILAISTAQGDLRELGSFLGYFIILNFQSAVFKRPGNENTRRPHFLYIDEFQTYSNPGFSNMLTQGRSYRVASHLATQNRALMAMGGGRDGQNFVELVSTNARNIVLFPGGNSKDAKYYSDEFGEELKKTTVRSVSRSKFNLLYGFQKMSYPNESLREDEKMGARFSASDLIYGDFGKIIYRIISNNSIQAAGRGDVEWLPKDYSEVIDEMVSEYDKAQKAGLEMGETEDDQEIVYPEDPVAPQPIRREEKREETMEEAFSVISEEEEAEEEEEYLPIASAPSKTRAPVPSPPSSEKQSIILDFDSEEMDDLI